MKHFVKRETDQPEYYLSTCSFFLREKVDEGRMNGQHYQETTTSPPLSHGEGTFCGLIATYMDQLSACTSCLFFVNSRP